MEDAMVTLFYSFFQFCQRRSDYDDAQERKLQALDFFFFFGFLPWSILRELVCQKLN